MIKTIVSLIACAGAQLTNQASLLGLAKAEIQNPTSGEQLMFAGMTLSYLDSLSESLKKEACNKSAATQTGADSIKELFFEAEIHRIFGCKHLSATAA